ncbi:MAG: P-loop NTPase [Desulfobacterales bacterium]|nr:P-loop NTPase [Desulfobacterales bacterium]
MERSVPDPSKNIHLSECLYVIRKRKELILASLFILVTMVTIFSFTMAPVYRATAKMVIDKEAKKSPLTGERLDYESYVSENLTFQTHFKLIKSRPVLSRVYEILNLKERLREDTSQGMLAALIGNIRKNVKKLTLIFRGESSNPGGQDVQDEVVDPVRILADKVDVKQVRDTRLLTVSVQDEDRAMAQAIANTVCKAYIDYNMEVHLEATQRTLSWLADQMGKMKQKLEESEARFLAFKEREKIFSITGKQKVHTQKIEEINTSYINTRANRMDVEARMAEMKKLLAGNHIVEFPPAFARNELLTSLYQKQAILSIELKKNQKVYKSKHPKMLQITTKLEQTKSRFRMELQKVLLSLSAEHAVLAARAKALRGALVQYEEDALETNKKEAQYAILEREVNTNKELHNMMSTKLKESMISQGIKNVNIRMVEPASKPAHPYKPRKKLNILLGIIIGVMTGVGFAFFLEYLDQTVRNPEDIEHHFMLPALAVVYNVKGNPPPVPRHADFSLMSHFAEAFNMLRTNIRLSRHNSPVKLLMVTGAISREGKTTVAVNLAESFAFAGQKVLLMECDLRLGIFKNLFPVDSKKGLSSLISETFDTPVEKGHLGNKFTLGDLMTLIDLQEKTGTVTIADSSDAYKFSFERGKLVSSAWRNRPRDKRLASALISSGKITEKQAREALDRARETGQRLSLVLLNMGTVSPDHLRGPLRLQIIDALSWAVFNLSEAKYRFVKSSHVMYERDIIDPIGFGDFLTDELPGLQRPFLYEQIVSSTIKTNLDNLYVLPCGPTPLDPSKVLGSRRMAALMSMLKDSFDYDALIIDSPPATSVSDASILSVFADGVVIVVGAGAVSRSVIHKAMEQLKQVNAPVLGFVLNRMNQKEEKDYYGYYSRYYSDYFDEGKKQKNKA